MKLSLFAAAAICAAGVAAAPSANAESSPADALDIFARDSCSSYYKKYKYCKKDEDKYKKENYGCKKYEDKKVILVGKSISFMMEEMPQ